MHLSQQEQGQTEEKPTQQQGPQAPKCCFCSERLLTSNAKVCNGCGRHQRGSSAQYQKPSPKLAGDQSRVKGGIHVPPQSDPLSQVN